MKIFLTGATGFLGRHLLGLLLDAGHTVHALVRDASDTSFFPRSDRLRLFKGDVTDASPVLAASENCGLAFHTAGIVSFDPRKTGLMNAVNAEGTANVCSACASNGVGRLLHVSSVNAIGYPAEGTVGDENTPFNWQPYGLAYMDTKRRAEEIVRDSVRRGLDAVIVNPGTMFGPGDIHRHSGEYIISISRGRLIGYIDGGFTQCIVGRVAEGCLLAAEKGKKGESYILGGFNLSYREIFGLIAEALGTRKPALRVPYGLFWLGEYSIYGMNRLIGKIPALTPGLIRAAPLKLFYSSLKAVRELGYRPGTAEDLIQAIREHQLWYREQKIL